MLNDSIMQFHFLVRLGKPCLAVMFVCHMVGSRPALGQADAPAVPPPDELERLIAEQIPRFAIFANDAAAPAERIRVSKWNNLEREATGFGATYVFVHQGRVEATCCTYPWSGAITFEFGSLSRSQLRGEFDGTVIWETAEPGLQFQPIPGARIPMTSRAARLLQLKKLARRFEATLMGWRNDNSDKQELRLTPRPLFRYQMTSGPIIDGAVFTFTMGVDPEAMLVIEAVQQDERSRFEYAFHRATSAALAARLDGQQVWEVSKSFHNRDPSRNFFGYRLPFDEIHETNLSAGEKQIGE